MSAHVDYYWKGLNKEGNALCGHILAPNKTVAHILLQHQGIQVKKLRRITAMLFFLKHPIRQDDINQFIRQLAMLLNAHIPLVQSFELIQQIIINPHLKLCLTHIKKSIQKGHSLSGALQQHPHLFTAFICQIIHAGEQSGTLTSLMIKLAYYQEQTSAIQKKVKAMFIYPTLLLCITLCIALGLLLFIVPEFTHLFNQFGAQLPWFTRLFFQLSINIKIHGLFYLIGIVSCIALFRYIHTRIPSVAHQIDKYKLKIPILGQILEQSIIARLMHTLALLLTAGQPLIDGLHLIEKITPNRAYAFAIAHIREQVRQGIPLQKAIQTAQQFPTLVTQMIAIGEESGKLEIMLSHIAKQYDDMFIEKTDMWGQLLEPLLMATLGIIIGALVIAMYLPIFQLGAIV